MCFFENFQKVKQKLRYKKLFLKTALVLHVVRVNIDSQWKAGNPTQVEVGGGP
jgi:hypothetical protein